MLRRSSLTVSGSLSYGAGSLHDEAGSCKVKPIVEKGPAIAKLKTALSSFDSLLKECS